jgi:hypothetical protein
MIVTIVASDHFRREPYPRKGAACGGGRAARPARSRAPANEMLRGSDGGSLATLAGQGQMWRRDVRPPSDGVNGDKQKWRQTKSPPRMAPRGLSTVLAMMTL